MSNMHAGIVFSIRLTEDDWRQERRGWDVTALAIPGIQVSTVTVNGREAHPSSYFADRENGILRWRQQPFPAQARVTMSISDSLATRRAVDQTLTLWKTRADHWRRLALALPIVSAILATALTAWSRHTKSSAAPQPECPPFVDVPATTSSTGQDSVQSDSAVPDAPVDTRIPGPAPVRPTPTKGAATPAKEASSATSMPPSAFMTLPFNNCELPPRSTATIVVAYNEAGEATGHITTRGMDSVHLDCIRRFVEGLPPDPRRAGKTETRTVGHASSAPNDSNYNPKNTW